MIVRELLAKLGYDVDQKKLEKWNKGTDRAKKLMGQAAKGAKQLAKGVAVVTVATVAASTALFKLVKATADVGDQAAKDAKKLGLTAESVQELGFAANLTGADFGKVKIGLQAFARGLNDATTKGTGPAFEAFEQLGISMDDPILKTKDLDKILPFLSDKFQALPDDANKTALAMKLFSKSGAEMIPLLNEGSAGLAAMRSEARALGLVMSNEQAAASEQFNDDLERLKSTLLGVRNTVATELMPTINDWINQIREWVGENKELIAGRIKEWLEKFVNFAKVALPLIADLVGLILKLAEAFGPTGLVAALIAVKLAGAGIPGLFVAIGGAAVVAGFKIAEAMESAESKIRRVQQLQANERGRQEIEQIKSETAKNKRATDLARKVFDKDGTASQQDIAAAIGAVEAAPDSEANRSLRESLELEAENAVIASNIAATGQIVTKGKKRFGPAKKKKGGGKGKKTAGEKELTADELLARDFGGGSALGPSATKPSLGTTINRIDASSNDTITIALQQQPGESSDALADRLVVKFREMFGEHNRRAVEHFRGALG